jgi:hypothetical protein
MMIDLWNFFLQSNENLQRQMYQIRNQTKKQTISKSDIKATIRHVRSVSVKNV